MKLSDFELHLEPDTDRLCELVERFNDNRTDYPRDKTVHALYREQAELRPDATAVVEEEREYSYKMLEQASNRLARFLLEQGLKHQDCVAVLLEAPFSMVAAILGILKAGGSYVPMDRSAPLERLVTLIDETQARVLVSEKRFIRMINRLQWECPKLTVLFCADSRDFHAEWEGEGELMKRVVWDHVGRTMFDDISGGGWTSSFTGEFLSRQVMDEYGDNIRKKLAPHLTKQSRVLEIACSTGISMFRLAPLVHYYCGTDLSEEILRWTERERKERGLDNIRLRCLAAHEIDRLEESPFNVVILNSVIQCFSGQNYLRQVLRKALARMGRRGVLFLGNVWDADKKEEFVRALREFRDANLGRGYRTKVDRTEELFLPVAFFEDLRHDFPEITNIEYSLMLGSAKSELSDYGYDAMIWIDKDNAVPAPQPRKKYQFDLRALDSLSDEPVAERARADSLAYVIYTSGSTGRPKGVMVEHRSIVRLVRNTNYLNMGPADRCLQTGPLAFDASTFEIWGPLLNGGAVCKPPERAILDSSEMARLFARHKITTIFLTTALFNQHVDNDITVFSALKNLLTGGEKVSVPRMNRVQQKFPELNLIHCYGPTENTTFTTCHHVDRAYADDVPIGRPIANTEVFILDGSGQLTDIGVPGEICTGGDGLARGYLNDLHLTRQKFVPHPFDSRKRLYHTGDTGLWRVDGTIEYLGRIDGQVKIRGYRIEPIEIQRHLLQQPNVSAAVVLPRDFGGFGKELVAYLSGDSKLEIDEVREHLKHRLPDYMIPSYFVVLDLLPLNANGKIDTKSLPDPDSVRQGARETYVPPETELERHLVSIWEEVLGRQGIGAKDDFFAAGGHSLKVTKAVALIEQRVGAVIPLTAFFSNPTPRALAEYLLDETKFGDAGIDEAMVPMSTMSDGPSIFALPPGTGDALGFVQLASLLKPYRFYAFNFIEADSRLQDYADLISAVDTKGPYLLFGYSSGGNLAYHVAQVLEQRGRQVACIVMIDSARKYQRIPFSHQEIAKIVDDFLGHESTRPYVSSPILMEKARRLIQSSYDYIERAVDHQIISADIHVLTSDDKALEHRDKSGKLLVSVAGWADITRGRLHVHQGVGGHNHMLYQPHLDANAEVIREIFDRTVAATVSTQRTTSLI